MTARRLSVVTSSRDVTPSNTSLGDIHELESFDDLASSQPISLSQLCTKRPVKISKRARAENPGYGDIRDGFSPASFYEPGHNKPRSRMSMIHHANSRECGLDIRKEGGLRTSGFNSLEDCGKHGEEAPEQAWYSDKIRCLQNPLSRSTDFDVSHAYPDSGFHGSISDSPFVRNNAYHSEYGLLPTDMYSLSNRASSVDVPPDNPYSYVSSDRDIQPDSSFSIYRASFDRPENQSPYESLHSRRSHYNPPDIRDLSATMQAASVDPHQEQFISHASPEHEPISRTVACQWGSNMGYYAGGAEWQAPHFDASPVQPPHSIRAPHPSFTTRSNSDGSWATKGSEGNVPKEEAAAFLKNMVEFSKSVDAETTVRHSRATDPSQSSCWDDEVYMEPPLTDTYRAMGQNFLVTAQKGPETRVPWGCPVTIQEDSPLDQSSFGGGYLYEDIMQKTMERALKNQDKDLNGERCKVVQPPPGIPGPVVRRTPVGLSFLAKTPATEQARIDEANTWFSTDGRWGRQLRQLRQQVADIGETHAGRIERLQGGGSDGETAKHMTQLLGDVIINLHSYASPDSPSQASSFANFGLVRSRYCEPSLGGRRSYYDRDPSIDHWKLPPRRVLSSPSTKPDYSVSSYDRSY
ncbi:hypothetical protein FE257_012025 [Aspergillus nanangensis]|uniref:Uncharacterized protein n=1 Tax=Aspergillus nanangensis TaxID=2582783 RepID=A0AAD4GR23_ASPNN|nr:hypothetical protein FE257_012025 [Aspergillus nanangensis]